MIEKPPTPCRIKAMAKQLYTAWLGNDTERMYFAELRRAANRLDKCSYDQLELEFKKIVFKKKV